MERVTVTRDERWSKRLMHSPMVSLASGVFMVAAGIIASYLLGAASVKGVFAGGALLLITIIVAAAVGGFISREAVLPEFRREVGELRDRLLGALDGLLSSMAGLDRRLSMVAGTPIAGDSSVLADTQFAALEAADDIARVLIIIKEMGHEFQDRIDERDAYVDYARIVLENVARGARYTYITEENSLNGYRARQMTKKLDDKARGLISVVQVPMTVWERLPFSVETVFMVSKDDSLSGYMLVPNAAPKESRVWVKLAPEYRDRWWSALEVLLPSSEPLVGVDRAS
jgi:hypothetical protein